MKPVLITSSILIVLVAALRPILRGRIDPRMQYALWLIAALRLLLPVELAPSAYSALALLERTGAPTRVAQAIGQTAVPVPAISYEDAYAQALREYEQGQTAATSFVDLEQVETRARELTEHSLTLAELAVKYARPVWLGGAALAALWFLLVNLRLRRKLKRARRLEDMDCPLPVFVSDALPSPCLCGVLRPRIYVTPAALDSPDRLRHVLAHELTHFRHWDHWWALVRCACLCLYWFDPLVWWAAALSRQDCELACDEGTIRRLGEEERIPYGRTLVDMIAAGRCSLMQTATTMTGGRRRVRERIKLIVQKPKTVIAAVLALVLILCAAVGCTFTGAPEDNPDALTLDSLQDRLMDPPEEAGHGLGAQSLAGEPFLVKYWMQEPWADFDEGLGWLLTVYQWNQEEFDQHYSTLTGQYTCIAQSEDFYFVLQRATDGYPLEEQEAYQEAYGRIRAYAEKAVLETEGVEPYNHQPPDTLQTRLLAIPENLRGDVTLYQTDAPDYLAFYVLDNASGDEGWEGWLCTVCQWDQAGFEDWLYNQEIGACEVFARDSEHYYALLRPTSVQHSEEDTERYTAAAKAIRAYARQTVLETEGVGPFDAQELRGREYLWEGKNYTDVAYWPYKNITGDMEDSVWIFRLVQLAEDGGGGVWIPERMQIIDPDVNPTPQHIKPDTGGRTVIEYAQWLQAEADAGRADWAADPVQTCMRYALTAYGHSAANVTEDCFTQDADYIRGLETER